LRKYFFADYITTTSIRMHYPSIHKQVSRMSFTTVTCNIYRS